MATIPFIKLIFIHLKVFRVFLRSGRWSSSVKDPYKTAEIIEKIMGSRGLAYLLDIFQNNRSETSQKVFSDYGGVSQLRPLATSKI